MRQKMPHLVDLPSPQLMHPRRPVILGCVQPAAQSPCTIWECMGRRPVICKSAADLIAHPQSSVMLKCVVFHQNFNSLQTRSNTQRLRGGAMGGVPPWCICIPTGHNESDHDAYGCHQDVDDSLLESRMDPVGAC
jgi:hypothetical protein